MPDIDNRIAKKDGEDMVDAIILAGEQPIKGLENAGNKALCLINGKMMIEYVIDAVRMADDIRMVVVVGPKDKLEKCLHGKADAVVEPGNTVIESIMAGIRYLNTVKDVLVCTCDIPLITADAINDFVSRSKALNAEFCYPIVEKSINDVKYPGMERTYVKTREGRFTGGNIFYINPGALEKGFLLANKFFNARKNPLKMARLLSFGFMVRLVLGNLTIRAVEEKVLRISGIKAKAVVSPYPELGQDVDKYSDLSAASFYLPREE